MIKSVCWHPDADMRDGKSFLPLSYQPSVFDVDVREIHLLSPIHFERIALNEIQDGPAFGIPYEAETRPSRQVWLKNVKYIIGFEYVSFDDGNPDHSPTKMVEMFEKRLKIGQQFRPVSLGRRRFVGEARPVTDKDIPIKETKEFGMMLWGIEYELLKDGRSLDQTSYFYNAKMVDGVITVPSFWNMLWDRNQADLEWRRKAEEEKRKAGGQVAEKKRKAVDKKRKVAAEKAEEEAAE
jgi:hypothetical protein